MRESFGLKAAGDEAFEVLGCCEAALDERGEMKSCRSSYNCEGALFDF